MITAENLTKYYGQKCALNDISFEVAQGEIVGLLGPNAAGKTTTMRILTGFFPPTSGKAVIDGEDVSGDSVLLRKKIGYLPESVPLYHDMTVCDFLNFAADAKGVTKLKKKERISTVMEQCNLTLEADKMIGSLSKGYKQRVGIAQAIINEPSVLVLDEPTVGLDPNQVVEIRDIIKNLAGNSTVIFSSHILEEVAKTCNKVIIMNQGKILAIDTPEQLSAKIELQDRLYLEVSGEIDKIKSLLSDHKGIISAEDTMCENENIFAFSIIAEKNPQIRKELVKKIVENNFDLYQLRLEKLTLEEIFTKIILQGGINK